MSNATSTNRTAPKPSDVVAVIVEDTSGGIDPRDAMRAAITRITDGATDTAEGKSSLWDIVRERVAYYVQSTPAVTRPVQNLSIMLGDKDSKDVVTALVWADATGVPRAVPAADRTAGQRALGTYLSRLMTVASDPAHGVDALADADSIAAAEKSRKDEKDARTAAKSVRDTAHALEDYRAWMDSIPSSDREAIRRAFDVLTGDSVALTHAPVFSAALAAAIKGNEAK